MSKITPCLWFDKNAEEAARYYEAVFPNSRIDRVTRSPSDYPAGSAGDVITVEFSVGGQPFMGLNGGPYFKFTEAVSFIIQCADQAEVDRIWDAILDNGGQPSACGWIKDRWGLAWQVTPPRLLEMIGSDDRDAAERAMKAMMEMVKIDLPTIEAAYRG